MSHSNSTLRQDQLARRRNRGGWSPRALALLQRRLPRVYVAGAYTAADPVLNVRRAVDAAEALEAAGFHAVVPHLCHLWHLIVPHDYRFWMARGLRVLASCDAVLRISGDSPGADEELHHADQIGVPLFTTLDELRRRFAPRGEVGR